MKLRHEWFKVEEGWHHAGCVPASLKNRRRVVRFRGSSKLRIIPSSKAMEDQRSIRLLLPRDPIEDEDVRLELAWFVESDSIAWRISRMFEIPPPIPVEYRTKMKGDRKGRSDLQGVVEAVCDAIQGFQIKNDSQVAEIVAFKLYG